MKTRDGEPIVWLEASDDGNLEEGWATWAEDEEYPTLCVHYEPR